MRRVGEEIGKGGSTPQGYQNAPQLKAIAYNQVSVNSLAMTDGEVREELFKMAHTSTTINQDITAQSNRDFAPRENNHSSTMATHFNDYTRMNSPMYF